MSFVEVERALVDLLFDEALRDRFTREGVRSLDGYALDDDERLDFADVNLAGLAFDAELRRDLMLARVGRAFPVTFALTSALEGGMALLRHLLGPAYVRAPRVVRTASFGESLRDGLAELPRPAIWARAAPYVDVEVALAWAAARLRETARAPDLAHVPEGWEARPLALAPHLCMAVLPRSYAAVLRELCPVPPDQLWGRLAHTPLPPSRLESTLAREEPRLFVGRARVLRASRCEATVDHVTLELSPGFAPLVAALDGARTAASLLGELARAGAPPKTSASVRAGLRTLLEQGMLRVT